MHVPEQHCDPEVQPAPVDAHSLPHVPDVQVSEQHSEGEVQLWPELLQKRDEVHFPEAHTVEQHCESAVQVSPPTPQA